MYARNLQVCMIMYSALKMMKITEFHIQEITDWIYADGNYLMFVDSDDYVEADYVEK